MICTYNHCQKLNKNVINKNCFCLTPPEVIKSSSGLNPTY